MQKEELPKIVERKGKSWALQTYMALKNAKPKKIEITLENKLSPKIFKEDNEFLPSRRRERRLREE